MLDLIRALSMYMEYFICRYSLCWLTGYVKLARVLMDAGIGGWNILNKIHLCVRGERGGGGKLGLTANPDAGGSGHQTGLRPSIIWARALLFSIVRGPKPNQMRCKVEHAQKSVSPNNDFVILFH